ncbi:glycosidase [Echinicola soli]|uniref:Glycosidase n=2 Tax=Echinicola soli TaxID=2591634 RepID=A0A514CPH5_9BACT|nr:glycosidase [Echinicola soli]
MKVSVCRKNFKFLPDSSRVVARFFWNGQDRTEKMINRVLSMDEEQVSLILEQTLRDFASRHRNISRIFSKHFRRIQEMIGNEEGFHEGLSEAQRMLIGSYCTMEYSIESAAMFNPSIVRDFDQSYLEEGEMRVILSFRATGEGHISSIVFRRAIIDKNNDLHVMKSGDQIDLAEVTHKRLYDKKRFIKKLSEMNIPKKYSDTIMEDLPESFEYYALTTAVAKILKDETISIERRMALNEMTWLVDSFYDVQFSMDSDLTERVLFPISHSESKGIEDARFVNFSDGNGNEKIYATYTAYNGHTTLPKLLSTEDFYTFRVMPLHGEGAQNKNLALFPKKIKGQFAMLARIDGVNNYIMFSDKSTLWKAPIKIQEPQFPWEYTQIGNCGSPLWTKEGWLIITHGVGPMRRYSIGASLLDLEDPTKEIGRLKEPLLVPLEKEREGYVPNVVYSCGAIIHNENLILPYAVSDYSSTYAVVSMKELLGALKSPKVW